MEVERKKEPAVGDGHDAGLVLCNLKKHGHGEIKVRPGRVAPTAIVRWKRPIRWTEVGRRHKNGGVACQAEVPVRLVHTLYLETRAATQSVVEQSCAQSRRLYAVALLVQISIPTRSSCKERHPAIN